MNDHDLDHELQQLFRASTPPQESAEFTHSVIARINQESRRSLLIRLLVIVLGLLGISLIASPLEFATLISGALTEPLITIEGSLGWLLMPVNNAGALMIALWKFLRMMQPQTARTRVSLLPF